jgi:hypothetical protein
MGVVSEDHLPMEESKEPQAVNLPLQNISSEKRSEEPSSPMTPMLMSPPVSPPMHSRFKAQMTVLQKKSTVLDKDIVKKGPKRSVFFTD